MNKEELQNYIRSNIPLCKAMDVHVLEASPRKVILSSPLAPNINHKKTAFGGSLHAIATMSCWALAFINFNRLKAKADLVIAESHVLYLRPVTQDILCTSLLEDSNSWNRFEKGFLKFGKSRLALQAKIFQDGHLAVEYNGQFAAVSSP